MKTDKFCLGLSKRIYSQYHIRLYDTSQPVRKISLSPKDNTMYRMSMCRVDETCESTHFLSMWSLIHTGNKMYPISKILKNNNNIGLNRLAFKRRPKI